MRQFKTVSTDTTEVERFQNNCVVTFGEVQNDIGSIRLTKPSYKYSSDRSIIISGSVSKPITIKIGNLLFSVNGSLICDLNTIGPGGLKRSLRASTLYYLYAIVSNQNVKLIADTNDPDNGGVTGLGDWSYIGSFVTNGSSNLLPFVGGDGVFLQTSSGVPVSFTATLAAVTQQTLICPVTANKAYLRGIWTAVNALGDALGIGPTSTTTTTHARASSVTAANNPIIWAWVSLLTANTIYTDLTNNADDVDIYTMGWAEPVGDWK